MGQLKVLVAGCGGISGAWLPVLSGFSDVTVAGLMDLDGARAAKAAADHKLGAVPVFTDLAEALSKVRPDIVCDLTVPVAHFDVVTKSLQAGCHVLGEKPMAESMDQARRMAELAKSKGLTYAVMQNRRYLPGIVRCRSVLDSGAVGERTTINADFYLGAHFGGFRDEMDHVLVLDMAIHTFDQARFLGRCDPVAVYCHEWNPRGSWYRHGACANAIFEMSNGIVFNYRGSWCAEGCNTSWEAQWRLCATRGTMLWDGNAQLSGERVSADSGFTRPQQALEVAPEQPMAHTGHAGCIRDFIDCVREGRTPQTTYADNIKSLAMVHAAIESATSRRRVEIRI